MGGDDVAYPLEHARAARSMIVPVIVPVSVPMIGFRVMIVAMSVLAGMIIHKADFARGTCARGPALVDYPHRGR